MSDGREAEIVSDGGPVWGSEADRVLNVVSRQLTKFSSTPVDDLERLKADAARVFSRCGDPHGVPERDSQLVVGRVQAGKTSNFTVVTGLARDNGYQLFVVLAGTKSELLDQTLRRLKKTLGAASAASLPAFWVQKLSIGSEDTLGSELRTKLSVLRGNGGHSGQAPVLVVLKQHDNLLALQYVLEKLDDEISLFTVPTLIFDDEADQASPDNKVGKPGNDTSVIHADIAGVRELLPWHSFLAYTATPQANLLMELNGLLHPRYVTVIDSGTDYVGVEELFDDRVSEYAKEVLDTPPPKNRPPSSLKEALAVLLCQIVLVRRYRDQVIADPLGSRDDPMTVTMLLNPGSGTAEHETWRGLAELVLDAWQRELADLGDLAGQRVVDRYIKPAWKSLHETVATHGPGVVPEEPTRDDLALLSQVIAYVERRTINSVTARAGVKLPEDDEWEQQVAWLFVGGEILGRGQTLVNLMMTYMPRTGGAGALDTVQQRGRFYGYHAAYRSLLRGWFEADTLQLYRDAAESESTLLSSLAALDADSAPLSTWTRAFLLGTGKLRATRRTVIPAAAREFTEPKWPLAQSYILDADINDANASRLDALGLSYRDAWSEWPGEKRKEPRDYCVSIELPEFLVILNDWATTGPEIQDLSHLSLFLGVLSAAEKRVYVSLVLMDRDPSQVLDQQARSYRSLQGSRSGSASRDRIGQPLAQRQRSVIGKTGITAQFHLFEVGDTDKRQPTTSILSQRAPSLVVYLPEKLRQRVLALDADE